MENVIIQSNDKFQAKKVKRIAIGFKCKVNSIRLPDNNKEGIEQSFSCPSNVSDKFLDRIREPGILEKMIPDKILSPVSEHDVKKPRHF